MSDEAYQKHAQNRRTLPEALDAAQDGEEFAAALQGLFSALEQAKDASEPGQGRV